MEPTDWMWVNENPKEAAKLIDDLRQELDVTDKLFLERNRVLRAIPECEPHGPCVPHALEWIEKAKSISMDTETAIRDYHFALDSREHGGVAQDKAIKAIESALNLPWRQGEELERRKAL